MEFQFYTHGTQTMIITSFFFKKKTKKSKKEKTLAPRNEPKKYDGIKCEIEFENDKINGKVQSKRDTEGERERE